MPVARGDRALQAARRGRSHTARSPVAQTLHPLAALHAMAGDRDEALRLMRDADAVLLDVGDLRSRRSVRSPQWWRCCAGCRTRPRLGCEPGSSSSRRWARRPCWPTRRAMLARVLLRRRPAARRRTRSVRVARAGRRRTRTCHGADRLARRRGRGCSPRGGRVGEAEALARAAVRLAADTDFLVARAEALTELGTGAAAGRDATTRPPRWSRRRSRCTCARATSSRPPDGGEDEAKGAVAMAMKFATVTAPR